MGAFRLRLTPGKGLLAKEASIQAGKNVGSLMGRLGEEAQCAENCMSVA